MPNRSPAPNSHATRVTAGTAAGSYSSTEETMSVDVHHAVVRLLPSTGLEGAFRVHLLPESLEQAQLRIGDLCEIASEDGNTGYGIAWRADDRLGNRPKNRPAKMTETIRIAFGFEEGSRVTITKANTGKTPAHKIVLSDVTPDEYNKAGDVDDRLWRSRIVCLFLNCEALATGISFDVTGRKKSRKRFYIESIRSRDASLAEAPSLFTFDDDTEIVFQETSPTANERASRLNTVQIGGLNKQCQQLNRQLRRLLDTNASFNRPYDPTYNPPILLYGFEGTGKSTLLGACANSGFHHVYRLENKHLIGSSPAKIEAIIKSTFETAAASQPSLILLDNIQNLIPSEDNVSGETLATAIKKLQDSRVMVIAATRSREDIKRSLLDDNDCFWRLIELPIPDLAGREQILNIKQRKPVSSQDNLASRIAARTYGFTGRDIAFLCNQAAMHARDRYDDESEQVAMGNSANPPAYADIMNQQEGKVDTASPQAGSAQSATVEITLQDFELALQDVRPTALREVFIEKPKIRWNDIGGSAQVKQRIDKIINWPLQHNALLEELEYQPLKGVLLYGPPGCSKTLTAQAVANTYNFNFIAIKGAELISMYVGESERKIREVFHRAKAARPCVIFFDEIDSIGSVRDSAGTQGLNVLTTLLNEMDGFESLSGVFILAATNKPEALDPALMRPGRFDSHVYLGPPNDAARREILAIATRKVPLSNDVNFDSLVRDTAGYSGAEIMRICQAAKEPAIEKRIRCPEELARICHDDFEGALRNSKKGITREMLRGYEAFAAKMED